MGVKIAGVDLVFPAGRLLEVGTSAGATGRTAEWVEQQPDVPWRGAFVQADQLGDVGVPVDLAVLTHGGLPGVFGEFDDRGPVGVGDLPADV